MPEAVTRPFSAQVILLVVAAAVSLVWDLGYTPFSLESGIGLAVGLAGGLVISLVTATFPRARASVLVLLFLCMLDVYFLQRELHFWLLSVIACALAAGFPAKVPGTVLVVCALVFTGSMLPRRDARGAVPVRLAESPTVDNDFLVHLMMDELGAFDSIPVEYRNQREIEAISTSYRERGFELQHGLHSLSPDTHHSMGVLMDIGLADELKASTSKVDGIDSYRINSSRLLTHIASRGWNVTIVQSWYIDYCTGSFNCPTYTLTKSSSVFQRVKNADLRLEIFHRQVAANLKSPDRGSALFRIVSSQFMTSAAKGSQWRNPTLPLVAERQLEFVRDAIIEGEGQQYVFAHILSPHFPWILDQSCVVKEIDAWRLPYDARRSPGSVARDEAFKAYWDQTVCAHRTLIAVIDAIDQAHPGRARFVIHGDHGPRIMARRIRPENADSTDEQTRRNVLAPFVATRVHTDTTIPEGDSPSLQAWLSEVLHKEAALHLFVPAAGTDATTRH